MSDRDAEKCRGNRKYGIWELSVRLAALIRSNGWLLLVSTVASIVGNLSHMAIMGFGSAYLLYCAGYIDYGGRMLWGSLTLVSALLIAVMRMVEGDISHRAAYRLLAEMRVRFFTKLRTLAPACLVDKSRGDVIAIAIADIETIESFFAHAVGPVFTVVLLPVAALSYAGGIDMIFVYALLPLYLIISVVIPLGAIRAGRRIGLQYRNELGVLKSMILESVWGLKDIQVFGIENRRLEAVCKKSREVNAVTHRMKVHRQIVTALPTFFVYIARIVIVAIAAYLFPGRGSEGGSAGADVVILSAVVSASFSSTQTLVSVTTGLIETFASAVRLFAIEDTLPDVVEREGARVLTEIRDIRFENVSFGYGENNVILKDLSVHIRKGDKVGIVGESGIGKSTILRLLLRFWDADRGRILLDGMPLTDVTLKSLRERIALIEQHTFIFDGTIAQNIAFGKPDASREDIVEAARRAGIHDFIETLPDGYDTPVGESGGRISGGERQRIGIARAMMMDPDVLVMDEPTSNLDVFSEKGIIRTIDTAYRDKTVIIVSHRPSTLLGCTRIFRLVDGRLVEGEPGAHVQGNSIYFS